MAPQNMTYHRAPPHLAARIRAALPQEIELPDSASSETSRESAKILRSPGVRRWAVSLAAAAACVGLSWNIALQMQHPNAELASQVVDDHVRSLMANHLMDVASSDQHTVKPWFTGKLDMAPPVGDFAEQGFTLVGGRLDYLAGRAVPALVYRHNEHIINMFMLPDETGDDRRRSMELRGYALLTWKKAGLAYWAVCDMTPAELEKLASLVDGAGRTVAAE